MRKESTESRSESRPEWEQLEDWVRSQVQRLIQELLEEEVTAFLGRAKSALRSDSDNDTGYRNGYGRARRLTLSSGTIQLRRPRVRDTEEQFESRLLPLFVNRTRKVAELIPELYLHGLSEGDLYCISLFFPVLTTLVEFRCVFHLPCSLIECAGHLVPAPTLVLRSEPSCPFARVLSN